MNGDAAGGDASSENIELDRERDRQIAMSFLRCGAQLITELVAGIPGVRLAPLLSEAAALLTIGEVRIDLRVDGVLVNENPAPLGVAKAWHAHMQDSAVASVHFTRGTSERELLKFFALLVAPGDEGAFGPAWTEYGAWHIRVRGTAPENGPPTQETDIRAMLEALAAAPQAPRRRQLFEAILLREADYAQLIAALAHPSWFVVRHAVALLGEQREVDADSALAALLHHAEPRVRAEATAALAQLQTATAKRALAAATRDIDETVRTQAWRSWAASDVGPPLAVVDEALRREEAPEAQRALLECTARFPRLEISDALQRFCARLFSRDSSTPELCILALDQLAMRRPQSALPFLRRLARQWRAK